MVIAQRSRVSVAAVGGGRFDGGDARDGGGWGGGTAKKKIRVFYTRLSGRQILV